MKNTTPMRFIRVFHRWSGISLILIVALKILSGLSAAGRIMFLPVSRAYALHLTAWLDVPLLLLFYFHALYGLYKIMQGKIQKKVLLFWCANIIGLLLFVWSIVFIYII
jgi:succinate dehydrogenase/fumarate reductase cytochrome b subunit